MDIDELHQALDSRTLELAYEKCLHQHRIAQENEEYRRLRVRLLLLESANDDLHAQIAEDDDYFCRIESDQTTLKEKGRQMEASLENAQGELRIKAREIDTLKAELTSLHGVTMDSTKLLTEKLALARELSSLRPEVDHLRTQAASNEKLLAEKLSLEHQLGTLQVKLENERKSMQRILAREANARAEDADVDIQLQAIQAEVSRERREKQKAEREAQQASNTWEAQKIALESRLESLKHKLRTTKDSLKETQNELENARSMAKSTVDERAASTHRGTAAANPRKRTATRMLSDSMIGTPGDVANERRTKQSSALPGDKSTFSITPFLNRTASVAPESTPETTMPALDADNNAEAADHVQASGVSKTKISQAPAIEKQPSSNASALGISKTSKTNAKAARGQNKLRIAAKLEKVAEEEQDENAEAEGNCSKTVGPTAEDQSILRGGEARKKKRKFLGGLSNTLFDEEDRETFKTGQGGRTFGSLSKRTVAGPKSQPLLAASSTSGNGFGAFSPLKRNIRPSAVGA